MRPVAEILPSVFEDCADELQAFGRLISARANAQLAYGIDSDEYRKASKEIDAFIDSKDDNQ